MLIVKKIIGRIPHVQSWNLQFVHPFSRYSLLMKDFDQESVKWIYFQAQFDVKLPLTLTEIDALHWIIQNSIKSDFLLVKCHPYLKISKRGIHIMQTRWLLLTCQYFDLYFPWGINEHWSHPSVPSMLNHFSFSNIVLHWLYCFLLRLGPYILSCQGMLQIIAQTEYCSNFRFPYVRPRDISHFSNIYIGINVIRYIRKSIKPYIYIQKPIHPGYAFQTRAPHTTPHYQETSF